MRKIKCSFCSSFFVPKVHHQIYCPECRIKAKYEYNKKYRKEWRIKNIERARLHDKLIHYRHYDKRLEQVKKYQLKHKDDQNYINKKREYIKKGRDKNKARARSLIFNAVKKGLIIRPDKCAMCGLRVKLEGHHFKGYDQPLEVKWLCRKCHVIQHFPKKYISIKRKEIELLYTSKYINK